MHSIVQATTAIAIEGQGWNLRIRRASQLRLFFVAAAGFLHDAKAFSD